MPAGHENQSLPLSAAMWPGDRGHGQARPFCWRPRARAVLEGRLAPSIDDVLVLAPPVLRHRMALTFAARAEGLTLAAVIEALCRTV